MKILIVGAMMFLAWFCSSQGPMRVRIIHAQSLFISFPSVSLFTPVPSSTLTTSATSPTNTGGSIAPAILTALIGLGAALLVALISAGVTLYQTRQTARLQREILERQHLHQKELQVLQRQHEQRMLFMQKDLEAQYEDKKIEEQRNAARPELIRQKMLLARTNTERAQAYRQAIHADPLIAHIQILDMSHPLDVANIYVQVRVHQESRIGYKLDPTLMEEEIQHDPNALLRVGIQRLEQRVSNAVDPEEAIHLYTHCVFTGNPGAGKTTLLKHLSQKSVDGQLSQLPDLPIYIELNTFASSGYHDLLDFASTKWDEHYGFPKAEARAYMEEKLEGGKALLLLDALDEAMVGESSSQAEASYNHVINVITQLATRYPQSPIVVTVRKASYQQQASLVGFTELEVLDFRPKDIQEFVINWFTHSQDPQAELKIIDLNTRLERNPRIQAIAANPLLLSLIVQVYEAQLDLPDRRA